jgi:hypothetical protein
LGNRMEDQRRYRKKLPLVNRDHTIAAWYAASKQGSWTIPTLDMTVWQRNLLLSALPNENSLSCDELALVLDQWLMQKNVLGLVWCGFQSNNQ